mmetsp:Transcript_130315/g.226469  ORF Transcript_130315/g.226469 Transcript_130315/m.226469 type:complete len:199 (+) Transcript_130315:586-1182(+)
MPGGATPGLVAEGPGEPARRRPGVPARGPGEPARRLATRRSAGGVPDREPGEPVRRRATGPLSTTGPRLPWLGTDGGDVEPGAPGLPRPEERGRAVSSPPYPAVPPAMLGGRRCGPPLVPPAEVRAAAAGAWVPPLKDAALLEPASRRGDCRIDASVRAVVTEELLALPVLPGPWGAAAVAVAVAAAAAAAPAPARAS